MLKEPLFIQEVSKAIEGLGERVYTSKNAWEGFAIRMQSIIRRVGKLKAKQEREESLKVMGVWEKLLGKRQTMGLNQPELLEFQKCKASLDSMEVRRNQKCRILSRKLFFNADKVTSKFFFSSLKDKRTWDMVHCIREEDGSIVYDSKDLAGRWVSYLRSVMSMEEDPSVGRYQAESWLLDLIPKVSLG